VDTSSLDVTRTFDSVPRSARDVRELVRLWLAVTWVDVPQERVDDAVLAASELVANALRHGGDSITVRLIRSARGCRIEVFDSGLSTCSPPAEPGRRHAEGQPLALGIAAALGPLGQVLDARGTTLWVDLTWR
jgi:anti-sigma regulatory factor (Ser/Thr protein kinase)